MLLRGCTHSGDGPGPSRVGSSALDRRGHAHARTAGPTPGGPASQTALRAGAVHLITGMVGAAGRRHDASPVQPIVLRMGAAVLIAGLTGSQRAVGPVPPTVLWAGAVHLIDGSVGAAGRWPAAGPVQPIVMRLGAVGLITGGASFHHHARVSSLSRSGD